MSSPNNQRAAAAAAAAEKPFISEKWATKLVKDGLLLTPVDNERHISKYVLKEGSWGSPF